MHKNESDAKKKPPRTVHIDVYCTGSEGSNSSDAEDDNETSHQTVFESKDVKVVHTKESGRLPQALCRQKRRTLSEASTSHSCIGRAEASDTNISSLYPSQRSSFASDMSLPMSLQTEGSSVNTSVTSSCGLFSGDLITSWKDTSEVESVRETDLGLPRAESFEYEDGMDRLRIMQKEQAWGHVVNNRKLLVNKDKHHTQIKRYQQYLERRGSPFPQWQPDEVCYDSSSNSDENSTSSEMAWSFGNISDKLKQVKREDTVRKVDRDRNYLKTESQLKDQAYKILESGSLSDSAAPSLIHHRIQTRDTIGPFGIKEPSPPKVKLESTFTTPFTAVPGRKTDQLTRAEKFGTIIGALRKPGHHVGPSKNPDCSCYNCRQFYKEMGYRNRTRSLGDSPSAESERDNWRATLGAVVQDKSGEELDLGTPV